MGTADMHRQDTPQRLDSTGTEVKNEDINTSQIVTSDDSLPITSQAHDGEAIGIDTAVPAESSAMDSQLQSYSDLPGFDDVRYDNDNDTNMTDAPEPDTSGSGKAAAAESNPYLMDSIVREITGAETVASADAITTENIQGSTPHDSVSEDLSLAEPPEAAITSTDTAPVTEMPPPPKFNLGASLFTRKKISAQNAMPKVAPALLNLDKLRAKRKKILDKYRTLGAAEKAHEASLLEDSSDSFSNGGMEIDPPAPAEVLDSEAEAFRKVEDEYSRKVRAGTVMQEEKIAFLQKEATELARLTKLKADAAYQSDSEQEEDDTASASDSVSALFVSETPAAKKKGRKRKSKELAEGDDGEDAGAIPSKAPAKKRSKASGRRKGFLDEEIEKVLTKVKSTQQARAAKKKADKAKADKAKADREKNKHDITNVASLHGTNVFKDAANNANLRSQPVFTKQKTRNKRNALAELIASIPSDDRRVAYGDKRLLEAALSDFTGKGSCFPCPDQDGQWKVKGMNYALKHYQVLGVAFMRRRESQLTEPRGGILADEMGLGKTIQMIANIINGKQLDKTSERKTTLIVASPALIQQWYNEIFKFARFKKGDEDGNDKDSHGLGSVIQHRAQHRLVGDEAKLIKTIKRSSICLTTYSEIQKSYPKAECPRELVTERQKSAWWKEFYAKEKGLFHKIEFHRIVLDEAQQIKNHKGHASMACRALTANHYWAISGTPLMNGVKEMYPYLKFIRYPHAGSMKLFLENFCSPDDPTGSEKLYVGRATLLLLSSLLIVLGEYFCVSSSFVAPMPTSSSRLDSWISQLQGKK
jgi:SNF2 family DNA or RNA helicase